MRIGSIFGQEFFWDHAEALEAVGRPIAGFLERVTEFRCEGCSDDEAACPT